jgi:hypothetical protein
MCYWLTYFTVLRKIIWFNGNGLDKTTEFYQITSNEILYSSVVWRSLWEQWTASLQLICITGAADWAVSIVTYENKTQTGSKNSSLSRSRRIPRQCVKFLDPTSIIQLAGNVDKAPLLISNAVPICFFLCTPTARIPKDRCTDIADRCDRTGVSWHLIAPGTTVSRRRV